MLSISSGQKFCYVGMGQVLFSKSMEERFSHVFVNMVTKHVSTTLFKFCSILYGAILKPWIVFIVANNEECCDLLPPLKAY